MPLLDKVEGQLRRFCSMANAFAHIPHAGAGFRKGTSSRKQAIRSAAALQVCGMHSSQGQNCE